MNTGHKPGDLKLTEDEAFALLGLCMVSPGLLDATSTQAIRKLAEYCAQRSVQSNHSLELTNLSSRITGEFQKAGA